MIDRPDVLDFAECGLRKKKTFAITQHACLSTWLLNKLALLHTEMFSISTTSPLDIVTLAHLRSVTDDFTFYNYRKKETFLHRLFLNAMQ